MSTGTSRIAVVAFCALAPFSSPTAAYASYWSVGLAPQSAGQAQSLPAPLAPATVTATCTSSTGKTVQVTWTAVATATYAVYQSSGTGYTLMASGVTATGWTSSTLKNGTYTYEVTASTGANWTSANSAPTAARTIKGNACS
ncbi:MAG: hypothetical protein WCD35_00390 [Mycobacteriales bacterium]